MPPIRGKLDTRKDATLELNERTIKIVVKGGFLGGKSSTTLINLDDSTSIEHGTGFKPYPDAMMIKVQHTGEEVSFYSINKVPVEKIAEEAEAYIEKRARILAEMEAEFIRDREAHVSLLYLNFEFVDALMGLPLFLDGSVTWELVEEQYNQVMRVNQDRDNLTLLKPAHLSLERLHTGVIDRDSAVIKSEVYDLVFTLREACAEKSKHKEPWFNTHYHRLFVDLLLAMWSRRFEQSIGAVSSENFDVFEKRVQELNRLMHQELPDEDISELSPENSFSDNHVVLIKWVELLQNAGFEPGEELERRLAA